MWVLTEHLLFLVTGPNPTEGRLENGAVEAGGQRFQTGQSKHAAHHQPGQNPDMVMAVDGAQVLAWFYRPSVEG